MNIPSDIQPTAQEQLQALSAQFLSSLPKKLQSIGLLLDQLRTNGWSPALAQSLHREIHGLTGSGAAFGCAAVSAQARLAENTLAQILDTEAPPDASSFDTLEAHIEELNAICSQARAPNRNKAPDTATTTSTSSLDALVPPMRILVVDDDPLIRAFLNALRQSSIRC